MICLQTRGSRRPFSTPSRGATIAACRRRRGQILRDGFRTIFATSSPWPPHRAAAAGLIHVRCIARKETPEIVHIERCGRADILAVLVGQRAGEQAAALTVDTLVIAEFTASTSTARLHARFQDLQADLPIAQRHTTNTSIGEVLYAIPTLVSLPRRPRARRRA